MVELLSPNDKEAGSSSTPHNDNSNNNKVNENTEVAAAGASDPAKSAKSAKPTKPSKGTRKTTPNSSTNPSPKKSDMAAPKTDKDANRVAEARSKNLDLAISQIQKDFGEAAIMRLGSDNHMDVEVIPTGNLIIDRALGAGGFPRGRIVEVYGP